MAARRLGQAGAYFTVREDLTETSSAADGVLWRERQRFPPAVLCNVRVYTNLNESMEERPIKSV